MCPRYHVIVTAARWQTTERLHNFWDQINKGTFCRKVEACVSPQSDLFDLKLMNRFKRETDTELHGNRPEV